MDFKPFSIYIGYDHTITRYQNGQSGKIPTDQVLEWLHENVDAWQFNWNDDLDPYSTVVHSKFFNLIDYISELNKEFKYSAKKNGGIFYFDTEEDRLLFCLKWVTNKEETIFWHPV
jgi:hypothetical protein